MTLPVTLALVAAACGGGRSAARTDPTPTSVVGTAPPSTERPTPTTTPGATALAAQATVRKLEVFDDPGATSPSRVLDNPWQVDPRVPNATVPQVFLVVTREPAGWVKVLLPIRPNGSAGWVRERDVTLTEIAFRIRVELRARRITVFERDRVRYQGPAAVGAPATPTPTGHYYIRVLMKAPDPTTVYGPYAYGLSSHSDALATFEGGDAEIGIHGNDDASVLGDDITHGCIRMDNAAITDLAGALPLGTPVDVVS